MFFSYLHIPEMKKAAVILFVVLAYVHIAGFTPFYFCALQEIKTEMALELTNKADLQQMHINTAEYTNPAVFELVDEHEFKYLGKMYDYKEVEKTKTGYIFYGLADDKETALTGLLRAMYEQDSTPGKKNTSPFAKLLKNLDKDFYTPTAQRFFTLSGGAFFTPSVAIQKALNGFERIPSSPPDFRV